MSKWQNVRMAADFDIAIDHAAHDIFAADTVTVEGVTLGGAASYGGDDESLWLPADYFKPYRSASPHDLARPAYQPPVELSSPKHRLGVCEDRACPKCNAVTERTLQRERKIVLGSSSGSGRKARKPMPINTAVTGDVVVMPELPDTRYVMNGFTRGLCEFYDNRQKEARTVLRDVVAYFTVNRTFPETYARAAFPLPPRTKRRTFEVRGLGDEQKAFFRHFGGIGRIALIQYAMLHGRDRLVARDGAEIWTLVAA